MKKSHEWKDVYGRSHKVYRVQYLVFDANGSLLKKYKQDTAARDYVEWYNSFDMPGFITPAYIIKK